MKEKLTSDQQEKKNKELYNAVIDIDLELVKELLKQGAQAHYVDRWEDTPLHESVYNPPIDHTAADEHLEIHNEFVQTTTNDRFKICKKLIQNGAQLNHQNKNGETPAHLSADCGNIRALKELIKKGARINIPDLFGSIPLHLAARNGHLDICKELIKKDALINIQNKGEETSLHLAARNGHLDICKELIKEGALVNIQNNTGETALQLAAGKGHVDICEELIKEGALVNIQNKKGETALHYAAGNGHVDICKGLIKKGALVNIQTQSGYTPLQLALKYNYPEIGKALITAGAEVNAIHNTTMYNTSALEYAMLHNNEEIVTLLISEGATIPQHLSEKIPEEIQIGASKDYQLKYATEQKIIVKLQQEITSQENRLTDIFTTIRSKDYNDPKMEDLLKNPQVYLKKIENGTLVTTKKFQHEFKEEVKDLNEWVINSQIKSIMLGFSEEAKKDFLTTLGWISDYIAEYSAKHPDIDEESKQNNIAKICEIKLIKARNIIKEYYQLEIDDLDNIKQNEALNITQKFGQDFSHKRNRLQEQNPDLSEQQVIDKVAEKMLELVTPTTNNIPRSQSFKAETTINKQPDKMVDVIDRNTQNSFLEK